MCADKDMDPPMAKSDQERLELFRQVRLVFFLLIA